ncbi:MAG: lysine--tRNA ligase [Phycisphaerales bacterium]
MSSEPTSPNASSPETPAAPLHELERQRRANREAAAALGLNPYGLRTDGLSPLAEARAAYDAEADAAHQSAGKSPPAGYLDRRPVARVAGRIMLLRDNGKLIWLTLRDHTGDLQVAVSQKDCVRDTSRAQSGGFEFAKTLDLGDIVIAGGPIMRTKTGEVTIWASSLEPASKALMPPPEKHAGLADVEIRYRRRYVDLWANPETMRVMSLRSRIVSRVRQFMAQRGYLEVETPMLQQLAGGAAARPFVTHMNALDMPLFMRIAPELYLKRLLVGGMPRVFEINRNFRNEGLDKQHNPEFTMLEAYHAFGDMETVMELTESLIREVARLSRAETSEEERTPPGGAVLPETGPDVVLPFGDLRINFSKPFARVTYASLFEKACGFSMSDAPRARAELKRRHPKIAAQVDQMDEALVVNELFEDKQHGGEAQLDPAVPTFVTHYPAAISPLVRPNRENHRIADRADLFIAGMEIAPHYTELNDPDVQESKFREQLKGLDADKSAEEATYRTFDQDFIDALKVGMPPAGGMGLGIDRLVMILTNQRTIRDVLLFPLMRPV